MSSAHYTTLPDGKVPLKVTCDGPASRPPRTVMDIFKSCVERYPQRPALLVKRDKRWKQWTYEQYYADVKLAAKSFIKLGLKPYHAVGILGFNSPEWFIANLGAIFAGGFAAGIYATNGPEACRFVADHARANIIVVENDKQLEKILQIRSKLPHLIAIVQYDGKVKEELKSQNVYEWADFMRLGADMPDYELQWRITPQEPGNCCTLIYTSGTTGEPKAVMISHDNITWTAQTCAEVLKFTSEDCMISYLPLSHVAAQMIDIHAPLVCASSVWFAQPDALKGSLVNTLKEVRPTLFLGVPRVWEKVMEKMQEVGRQTTGFKASIAKWAKEIGIEGGYNIQRHQDTPFGWWLADTLVFSKVKEGLGLDRCRIMATSAAPISKECLEYFLSLNIPIYELYGMSECTGPETLSYPGFHLLGSCGIPVPGAELKIMDPDQEGNGETCFRGRHVFMGYLFNEAKTKEAIDENGWLHSGDIGRQNKDGFLFITGRIKELIITAGGENVAPVPIEDAIKQNVPIISNCMLIGDRKKFLSLLVTLKTKLDADGNPSPEFTQESKDILKSIESTATTIQEAQTCPKLQAYITKGVMDYNKSAVSNAQKVQKFKILPRDFSIHGEELTPTMKLRRPVVTKMYNEVIESMYADGGDA